MNTSPNVLETFKLLTFIHVGYNGVMQGDSLEIVNAVLTPRNWKHEKRFISMYM